MTAPRLACHLNVVVPDLEDASLDEALPGLAELGYEAVVLPPIDPQATDLAALGARFRDAGLSPITIAGQLPGADVASDDSDDRVRGVSALKLMVEASAALGCRQVNGVPYGVFGDPRTPYTGEQFARSAALVGEVADYAAELGMTMTFEVVNRYETAMLNTAEQAAAYIAASGSKNLTMHLDSFHMAVEESDPVGAVARAVPQLGYLELGQSGRGGIVHGSADNAAILRAALSAGYTGLVGVEAFTRPGLVPFVGDLLRIWRAPYTDGLALAREAAEFIRAAAEAA